jgi:hypothetical protein
LNCITGTTRYHSDPFYLEVNSNPEHSNVTAVYIDNYSQIAIDFGKTNSGHIKLGTRFNAMDVYVISSNNVPEIVRCVSAVSRYLRPIISLELFKRADYSDFNPES